MEGKQASYGHSDGGGVVGGMSVHLLKVLVATELDSKIDCFSKLQAIP